MQRARADEAWGTPGASPPADAAGAPAPKRRGRRLLRGLIAVAVLVAAGAALGLVLMSRQDARHALFYNSGKTINGFLKDYCDGLEQAIATGDPAPVTRLYAAGFASPGRGRWSWRDDSAVGAIGVERLAKDLLGDLTQLFGLLQ